MIIYCVVYVLLLTLIVTLIHSFQLNSIQYQRNLHNHAIGTRRFYNTLSSTTSSSSKIEEIWLNESNAVSYVDDMRRSFKSLEAIGIVTESSQRTILPSHESTSYELFCNRELNMQQIEAIGFDMDWTLAQYTEAFDLLAYEGAKDKLVNTYNYPKEVLDFVYKKDLCRRGCIVDIKRGNVIKLDRHRYVHSVEHGLTTLSSVDRKSIYMNTYLQSKDDWFKGKGFANIDTPFSLVDSCLFMQLVDLKDNLKSVNFDKSYEELHNDMRRCIDRCHKDGVIKLKVAEDPSKYIIYDPNIFPMLDSFRAAGKKLFLLTNSLYDYTQVVMNYLEGRRAGDAKNHKWMDYFDMIIVGGNKPFFLVDEKSLALFRINQYNECLENIDNFPLSVEESRTFLSAGKLFQGGNAVMLHKLLQIKSSDRVLYVGDHVYADILRSKRSLGWRTCLIIPELTYEIGVHRTMKKSQNELMQLKRKQYILQNELDKLEDLYNNQDPDDEMNQSICESLQLELITLRLEIRKKLDVYGSAFHPKLGPLFRAGFKESRFANQIKDYACIYTSRASNLGVISPMRPLRPVRDQLPHEVADLVTDLVL